MIIFDTPVRYGASPRVGIIGSCRSRNCFIKLGQAGRIANALLDRPLTHSAPDAVQALAFFRGERSVPDFAAKYIFEKDRPAVGEWTRDLVDSVDVFVVEVCERKYVRYRDWYFQLNYFNRQFVQEHAAHLLPWFRNFAQKKPADPALVDATIESLVKAGVAVTSEVRSILAETVLVEPDAGAIEGFLRQLTDRSQHRWILLSHFAIPGDEGAVMRDRRGLAADLAGIAQRLGMRFFDPTQFIVEHGRKHVLDADGADIYEWAPNFIATVGERLIRLACEEHGASAAETNPPPAPRADDPIAVDELNTLADTLNGKMLEFVAEKVPLLGVEKGGIYNNHVAFWLNQKDLMSSARKLATFILNYVPDAQSVTVVKGGLGQLAFLLAQAGFRVTVTEPNDARHRVLSAFAERLAADDPGLSARLRVIHGLFPPETESTAGSLAVADMFVDEAQPIDEAQALAAFARFTHVIVTPRTFLKLRKGPGEQHAAAQLFKPGFSVRELPRLDIAYMQRDAASHQVGRRAVG